MSSIREAIREIVRTEMQVVLGDLLEVQPVKRGPGRPPKALTQRVQAPEPQARPARRGRRGKLTAEQKRQRAAAYQKAYRARKKAETQA